MLAAALQHIDAGYRHFLYAPEAGRFHASAELDKVAWPEFDPAAKTATSYRRRGDGTSGHDVYVRKHGRLEPR